MRLPRWRKIERRRRCNISYLDPEYVKYYDLDNDDFETLVLKLKNNERLTEAENERYGIYILTICLIVQYHVKFRNKTIAEREELLEQQYWELLQAIQGFEPDKGKIYSYAYRIGFTAACHYYTNIQDQRKKDKRIIEHCQACLDDYYSEYSTHKVERH